MDTHIPSAYNLHMLVYAFEFAWITDKIPCGDISSWDSLTAPGFVQPSCFWLAFSPSEVHPHRSTPLPHLSQLPNIESYFLPSPPAPMGQVVVLAFYPFLFPSSWYQDLPIDTTIVLSSCQKRSTCWSLAFNPVLTPATWYQYKVTSFELALGSGLDYDLNCYWMSDTKFTIFMFPIRVMTDGRL